MYPSADRRARTRGARARSGIRTPEARTGSEALEDADALLHLRALRVPVAGDEGLGDDVLLQDVLEVAGGAEHLTGRRSWIASSANRR